MLRLMELHPPQHPNKAGTAAHGGPFYTLQQHKPARLLPVGRRRRVNNGDTLVLNLDSSVMATAVRRTRPFERGKEASSWVHISDAGVHSEEDYDALKQDQYEDGAFNQGSHWFLSTETNNLIR